MAESGYILDKLQALIVDDYAPMRVVVREVLHQLGVKQTAEAMDGASAIEAMDRFQPDIIFTDWRMEPMDGISLVKQIRAGKTPASRFVPIVMISGFNELWRVARARDAGINEYLIKPVSAKSLFARIKAIVDQSRQFVAGGGFFGPDRRRRVLDHKGDDRRGKIKATSRKERRDTNRPFHGPDKRRPR